jgi:galactose mutarotase-like enzyme
MADASCSVLLLDAAVITELDPVQCVPAAAGPDRDDDSGGDDDQDAAGSDSCSSMVRIYRIRLGAVTVELCSLGASILRILLPSPTQSRSCAVCPPNDAENVEAAAADDDDDVVLGFDAVQEMYESQNPAYFGVVPGRVANRIQNGRFRTTTRQQQQQPVYHTLDRNNPPNHLHGGNVGFSRRIWDAAILRPPTDATDNNNHPSVQFSLLSEDGDQGYPGAIQVTATYSLRPTSSRNAVQLRVDLRATLLDGTAPTPVNLTQHAYFNLAGHGDRRGILDHTLRLYCDAYTPVDESGIPTREVRSLGDDPVMDWSRRTAAARSLGAALQEYGTHRSQAMPLHHPATTTTCNNNVEEEEVAHDLKHRNAPLRASTSPYGFDHNYVVVRQQQQQHRRHEDGDPPSVDDDVDEDDIDGSLALVAVLCHPESHRRLSVRSTAPGVQLYTANYLDGTLPVMGKKKRTCGTTNNSSGTESEGGGGDGYCRWQGVCLETQAFPDSIGVDEQQFPEFAAGQCPILTSQQPNYRQMIEYTFEYETVDIDSTPLTVSGFHGTDSSGSHYYSIEDMWEEMGVTDNDSASWYERAATYYNEHCPPTIDGVLGGFASITDLDLAGSLEFVRELEVDRPAFSELTSPTAVLPGSPLLRACECGAGLGRVTKGLLSKLQSIRNFDLVESSSALLAAAPDYLGDDIAGKCRYFCIGLQDWQPAPRTYSVIWIQWVLSYLTDTDIVAFLRRCGAALAEDGIMVLKENACADTDFEVDLDDASVTRSSRYWKVLFRRAGLRIVHEKMQDGLPSDIYPVPMLALEPSHGS